jgi:hypothetical protein
MWSVASILTGLQSFFYEDVPTTGSVAAAPHERRALAAASLEHNARVPLFAKARPRASVCEGGRKKEGCCCAFVCVGAVDECANSHVRVCLLVCSPQMFEEVIAEQRALRAASAPPPLPPPPPLPASPDGGAAAAGSPAAPSAAAAAALAWSAAQQAQAQGAPQGQQQPHAPPPPLPPHAGAPHAPLGGGTPGGAHAQAQAVPPAGGATWLARLGALAVLGGVLAVLAVPLLSLELSGE